MSRPSFGHREPTALANETRNAVKHHSEYRKDRHANKGIPRRSLLWRLSGWFSGVALLLLAGAVAITCLPATVPHMATFLGGALRL